MWYKASDWRTYSSASAASRANARMSSAPNIWWSSSSSNSSNNSKWWTSTSKWSSSSSSWWTYKYNPTTGYYERTDWWTNTYWYTTVGNWKVSTDYASKYANNGTYNSMVSQYWADAVHKALDYTSSWGKDSNQLKNILSWWNADASTAWVWSAISKMIFGKWAWDLNSQATRNKEIANLMKESWIKFDNSKSVREFLEKYWQGYKEASDEDKNNTANKIFWLYSPASNDDTLNIWENLDGSNTDDTDYATIDWLLEEEWIAGQDDNSENNWQDDTEEYDERDEIIRRLQEENLAYREREANYMEDSLNNLSQNNQTEEKKWLSDVEKEANTAASAAAWNAAQWWNSVEAEAVTAEQPATQPVVNSENYWDRQTKIMNILWNLWYNIDTTHSEQAENAEISNAIEWWEPVEWAEEQAAIAESNATNWEETPIYIDEPSLVTSYQKAFDNLLQQWPSPETAKEAIKTYLQAKDATALFVVQNKLSDEAYQNILNQIKSVPSLKDLLKNYNK